MTNANIALLTQNNTFGNWLDQSNAVVNVINSLLNGLFYADNGSIELANGTITLLGSSGTQTLLSVSGNATISGTITAGDVSVTRNVSAGNVSVTQNLSAGNLSVTTGLTAATLNVTTSANAITLNVKTNLYTQNFISTNAATTLLNVSSIANLQAATVLANNITLDNASSYSLNQGNAVLNNLTVKGSQTIEGSTVLQSNAFLLRNGATNDGDGAFQTYRGPTIAANATILFNNTANVLQFAANDAQTFATLLTTSNLVDNYISTNTQNAATANAVNSLSQLVGSTFGTVNTKVTAAYNEANAAANTVATYANGTLVLADANLNFNNSATVNVTVQANGTTQTNVSFVANSTAIAGQPFAAVNSALAAANSALASDNAAFASVNSALASDNAAFGAVNSALGSTNSAIQNLNVQSQYINVGVVTGNTNINCAAGGYQDLMLAGNINVFFQNTATRGTACTVSVYVRQSQNGGNTATWTNTIMWSDNNVPALSTAKNTADMFTFTTFDGGTIWIGVQVMGNVPLANTWF